MGLKPTRFVDGGLDWCTFTAPLHSTGTELASRSEVFIESERHRGCFLVPWSMSGYQGFKCGSIAAGTRHDSGIVRLSGVLAQQHWRYFYEVAENCSRIDLQATFRYEEKASAVVTSTYRGVLNHRRRNRRGPTISIWKEAGGGATIYFGKRVSELFGRVYDKALESKLSHYDNCVRFELEVKGKAAWSNICDLASKSPALPEAGLQSLELNVICSWLADYFRRHGCTSYPAQAAQALLRSAHDSSDSQQALEWLRSQVAPSVKRLCSMGFTDEVRNSLFGVTLTPGESAEDGLRGYGREWGVVHPSVEPETEGNDYEC